MLRGDRGRATEVAMRIVARTAAVQGATRLLTVTRARRLLTRRASDNTICSSPSSSR